MKAIGNDRLAEVSFRHRNHVEEDTRHLHLAVIEIGARDHGLPLCQTHREFCGFRGELLERLVDRHALRASNDALARRQFRVLSRDENFSREPFFRERLNRPAGGAVIAGEDRVKGQPSHPGARLGDRGIRDLFRILRLPILSPILVHDFDGAGLDQRREDLVLALLEERRIVVGLRTVDAQEALLARSLREGIDQILRLQFADPHIVESHINIEVAAGDEPIVGEHRNSRLMRQSHRFRARRAIVRDDHEHLHALRDQSLHVLDLADIVAVRVLHDDFGAEFLRPRHKHVPIALPAFLFQRIHREPDERSLALRRRPGTAAPRNHESHDDAEQTGDDDEREAKFHPGRGSARGYGVRLRAANANPSAWKRSLRPAD